MLTMAYSGMDDCKRRDGRLVDKHEWWKRFELSPSRKHSHQPLPAGALDGADHNLICIGARQHLVDSRCKHHRPKICVPRHDYTLLCGWRRTWKLPRYRSLHGCPSAERVWYGCVPGCHPACCEFNFLHVYASIRWVLTDGNARSSTCSSFTTEEQCCPCIFSDNSSAPCMNLSLPLTTKFQL